VKKKNMKVICLVKISEKGIIKEFDKATTLMYEMKDDDLMGQNVKILFNADAGPRFLDHFKDYVVRSHFFRLNFHFDFDCFFFSFFFFLFSFIG